MRRFVAAFLCLAAPGISPRSPRKAATQRVPGRRTPKLRTSQPRVAKIERAASDVSLDQLVRAFSAAGGKIVVKAASAKPKKARSVKNPAKAALVLEAVTVE
ncbi:MAG: hypothetical protein ABR915_20690 [Thermoguttaceae bacterium]